MISRNLDEPYFYSKNNLTRLVSRLVEVRGERPGLVVVDPLGGGAVLVVGEHVVVVRVEPGQHGRARGAVEGSLLKFGIKFERAILVKLLKCKCGNAGKIDEFLS